MFWREIVTSGWNLGSVYFKKCLGIEVVNCFTMDSHSYDDDYDIDEIAFFQTDPNLR